MKKIVKVMMSFMCMMSLFGNLSTFAMDAPASELENQKENRDPQTLNHDYLGISNDSNYEVKITGEKPSYLPSRRASVTDSAWTNYGIQRYYQDDYTGPTCSGGGSIAEFGCAITSFSMVLAKYEVYQDPPTVFNRLLSTGGITGECFMTWNAPSISRAFPGIKMEHWNNVGGKESVGMQAIEGVLKTGKPVIVGIKNLRNNGTHYVVCYGYEKYSDGGSFHYLFNPQRGRSETLEGYMADWYIMNFTTLYR